MEHPDTAIRKGIEQQEEKEDQRRKNNEKKENGAHKVGIY